MTIQTDLVIRGPCLVDAHVHFYSCYDAPTFMNAALAGFRRGARELGVDPRPRGWLLLTETANDHFFRRLRDGRPVGQGWTVRPTDEAESLIASRDGEEELVLIAGRQVVTAERLEVLALGCDSEFEDGASLGQTVDLVRDRGALAAIPWGFGKWWFRRGAILRNYLRAAGGDGLFLGDNAARWRFAPAPTLFRLARRAGIPILPGSDTFPMEPESRRVGGFGFALDLDPDLHRPAEGLKQALRSLRHQPPTFGRLESLGRFCRNQVLMQLRSRRRRARR